MFRKCILKLQIPKNNRQNYLFTSAVQNTSLTSALKKDNVGPLDPTEVISPEKLPSTRHLENTITIKKDPVLAPLNGIPEEHVKDRLVRIYRTSKNCMQSGTNNVGKWQMDFDVKERWENPLMGWISTGDPLSNMKVQFLSKEDAIKYCDKMGWKWFVQENKLEKPFKPKNYGLNFAWNKRTRTSTK